ncbi:MAG: aminotransferase class III-fold pyridoxal phosphate-dependent enzyme, partial [Pseudomonadota bacterium]
GSLLLGADPGNGALAPLTRRIEQAMAAAETRFSLGRYLEPRMLYAAAGFGGDDPTQDRRTVHLGVDVFCAAGTPVCAPLAGRIHRVGRLDRPLDYGPVLMLRHDLPDGESFFTLYGHLAETPALDWNEGDRVDAGTQIASVGAPPGNGGWPAHLHLQLILDDFELGLEFAGVCDPRDTEAYAELCPNPGALLGIDDVQRLDARRLRDALAERRARALGPSLSLSYRKPLHVVRGFGAYLYDDQARGYLDFYNNVAHVGHSHPHVVGAVQRQIALLNTNTRYLHSTILDYAERLCGYFPDPLSVCYFVNSASEANELALRLARHYTGRRDIVVAADAYHGHTSALIDMSPYKYNGPGGAGPAPWVHEVPVADDYRGPFRRGQDDIGACYAATVRDALAGLDEDQACAAFFAETMPSVGGQIIPPPGYLKGVYEAVRAHGGLCIADEVQTGFGRLGQAFWGFETQDVVPDIVVLGKPIANGFPMGAVVTTPQIANAFDNGMEFFATFGGNPVACAAASAMLDVVEQEGLAANAARLGSELLKGLWALAERYPLIGDVRGLGFFLGVELVLDRTTLTPAPAATAEVVERLLARRVLAGV